MPEKIRRLPPYCMRLSKLKWKNDLDRHQFEFNEQILDSLRMTLKALEQGATSQAVTLVESSIKDLLQHQTLVRFADQNASSLAGASFIIPRTLCDTFQSKCLTKQKQIRFVNQGALANTNALLDIFATCAVKDTQAPCSVHHDQGEDAKSKFEGDDTQFMNK
uniref:Uncharacterized protein n=1 Tax=Romanomermis culicivorax TaxID=13658 RepID=A0A915I989_ROMCU